MSKPKYEVFVKRDAWLVREVDKNGAIANCGETAYAAEANAKLIANALNSHDALVELSSIVNEILIVKPSTKIGEHYPGGHPEEKEDVYGCVFCAKEVDQRSGQPNSHNANCIILRLQEALEKAEGEIK